MKEVNVKRLLNTRRVYLGFDNWINAFAIFFSKNNFDNFREWGSWMLI